jgi:hypothetical protein
MVVHDCDGSAIGAGFNVRWHASPFEPRDGES